MERQRGPPIGQILRKGTIANALRKGERPDFRHLAGRVEACRDIGQWVVTFATILSDGNLRRKYIRKGLDGISRVG
jgi:hypothetical protein